MLGFIVCPNEQFNRRRHHRAKIIGKCHGIIPLVGSAIKTLNNIALPCCTRNRFTILIPLINEVFTLPLIFKKDLLTNRHFTSSDARTLTLRSKVFENQGIELAGLNCTMGNIVTMDQIIVSTGCKRSLIAIVTVIQDAGCKHIAGDGTGGNRTRPVKIIPHISR